MEESFVKFAEVMVPLPVPGLFTYRIPRELEEAVRPGCRVVVQFGKRKILTALVREVHMRIPQDFTPKYILSLLDEEPIVHPEQFKLWDWISTYYVCHPGEVMSAALPSALRLNSEAKIMLHPAYEADSNTLSDNEFLIIEALHAQSRLTIDEVSKIVGFKKVMPLIKTMTEKHYLIMEEELEFREKPKKSTCVRLSKEFQDEVNLKLVMDQLAKRAYKQMEALMAYLKETRFPAGEAVDVELKRICEISGASAAQARALVEKGVFVETQKTVSRLERFESTSEAGSILLSEAQQQAFDRINHLFEEKSVVLLRGVTSSGKTEIYIRLIDQALKNGKQVLYLLPEIALTTQVISRLRHYFGNQMGVYHSRYSTGERVELWREVLKAGHQSERRLIVGPRSALFLPYSNLGLIVVDEEHDASYKQYDPAPRYQARDTAIILARLYDAKVLLGSATPSLESWYNARAGRYGLVQLNERYGGYSLPQTLIVNMREEARRNTLRSHFSSVLMEKLQQTLEAKKQIILFQNRRGFSLRIECGQCNWIPECLNCDVSLVYHKKQNLLRCHYCGYAREIPEHCPECNSTDLKMQGFGTEKVEEELSLMLQDVRIARLDLDTTRTKHAFQQILEDFGQGKSQVLTGTQMVTKGLDFDKVNLVGILNADNLLSYPDFRAFERSFQLMAQVSGRAGRKNNEGWVVIQTSRPKHEIFRYVVYNAYEEFAEQQLAQRKQHHYPPFVRLIELRLLHRNEKLLNEAAYAMNIEMRKHLTCQILGPEYPVVSRIRNLYIKQFLIKIPRNENPADAKQGIMDAVSATLRQVSFKQVRVQIDVDP
ncbi:MAG TPA: primosomal protein N' [Bacteroidales bacterium]|mgnify:CR=1 FL=1|nr:primosomal protein N' [Bacteroidales bacterium]